MEYISIIELSNSKIKCHKIIQFNPLYLELHEGDFSWQMFFNLLSQIWKLTEFKFIKPFACHKDRKTDTGLNKTG